MARAVQKLDRWAGFKNDPQPLAQVREVKEALPVGVGLRALYDEVRTHDTVLGVPVLRIGRKIYIPRQRFVDKVEGLGR